jgi:hypothetical protein
MNRIALALLFGSFLQTTQPPAKATITGTVLRAGTGEPIARATVTLIRAPGGFGAISFDATAQGARGASPAQASQANQSAALAVQGPTPPPTVTTDERGHFQLNDVDPGSYRIAAGRNGFARQEYGQRSFNRSGTIISIRAGQQVSDIEFKLTPASTISGRVIDMYGEPQPGITVQALRSTYDANGKRTLQAVQSARTNDLGEYRLYWLNPGRYFVSANGVKSAMETMVSSLSQAAAQAPTPRDAQAASQLSGLYGPGAPANEIASSEFTLTYYPGTPDISRAVAIDLPPAAESHLDFNLTRGQRFRIRGKVVDAATGRPPQMATLSVSPRNSAGDSSGLDALFGAAAGMLQGNRYNPATGEFEVRDVAAGSYWLTVQTQQLPAVTPGARGGAPAQIPDAASILSSINRAQVPVEVDRDLENIPLIVSPGITIPGRIRIEGNPPAGQNPYSRLTPMLETGGGSLLTAALQAISPSRPADDGTFSMTKITPGDYKLVVNGMDPNMYIKDAHIDRTDVLQGISIGDRLDGTLEIVLSTNAGQIDGTIVDAAGKPISGVTAVLIPDRLRNRNDLYKAAVSAANGRFTFRGVSPGDYKLFAWEDIEPFSYFDPDVLMPFETRGKPVHIQENSKEPVEVKIIPAAQ